MSDADRLDWLLSRRERDNAATRLDAAHPDRAYSRGNRARPLVHGATYFAALKDVLDATGAGDLVLFTDWQSNPDERLTDEAGSELVEVLGRAIERGADVRALVWRSHSDLIGYSTENHHDLAEQLQERGAEVLLDMRVRAGGAPPEVRRRPARRGPRPGRRLRRRDRPVPHPP